MEQRRPRREYYQFLFSLFFIRYGTAQTIRLLLPRDGTHAAYLKYALRNNHISEKREEIRKTKNEACTKRTYRLFSLTAKGLLFLADGINPETTNGEMIRPNLIQLKMKREYGLAPKVRTANTATIQLLTMLAGGHVPKANFEDVLEDIEEYEEKLETQTKEAASEKMTVPEYVRDIVSNEDYQLWNIVNRAEKTSFRFVPHWRMTRELREKTSRQMKWSAGTRIYGVAESREKCAAMYYYETFGMSWAAPNVTGELELMKLWADSKLSLTTNLNAKNRTAIIVLKDRAQFKTLWFDSNHARAAASTNNDNLGEGYAKLYILPVNAPRDYFAYVMTSAEETEYEELCGAACKSMGYQEINRQSMNPTFRMAKREEDSGEVQVAFGYFLDYLAAKRMKGIAERSAGKTYELWCFEWQQPYYEAVMPANIKIKGMNYSIRKGEEK